MRCLMNGTAPCIRLSALLEFTFAHRAVSRCGLYDLLRRRV